MKAFILQIQNCVGESRGYHGRTRRKRDTHQGDDGRRGKLGQTNGTNRPGGNTLTLGVRCAYKVDLASVSIIFSGLLCDSRIKTQTQRRRCQKKSGFVHTNTVGTTKGEKMYEEERGIWVRNAANLNP